MGFEEIEKYIKEKEKNIELVTKDPTTREGFTQVPNFVLKKEGLSPGAKVTYAMFLSYAWHNNYCFPGQERLSKDIGVTRPRVTQYIGELESAQLVTITRRGQGKTNLYKIHFVVQKKGKKGR